MVLRDFLNWLAELFASFSTNRARKPITAVNFHGLWDESPAPLLFLSFLSLIMVCLRLFQPVLHSSSDKDMYSQHINVTDIYWTIFVHFNSLCVENIISTHLYFVINFNKVHLQQVTVLILIGLSLYFNSLYGKI